MATVDFGAAADRSVRLPDERVLGYREYGDANGRPLFYFHGWPSCRLEAAGWDAPAKRAGVRIISADRPGIATSTYKAGFRLRDWPTDVSALAEALGIGRFAVVGISSGGPYSLACGRYLPEMVTAAGLVGGVGPLDVEEPGRFIYEPELQIIGLARWASWVARAILRVMLWRMARNPEKALVNLEKQMTDADRTALADPQERAALREVLRETGRAGAHGLIDSIRIEGDPWGFALEEVTVPVFLWQGEEDTFCYPEMARYMAEQLPDCRATFCPGEGHFSTIVNRAEEILSTLAAASD